MSFGESSFGESAFAEGVTADEEEVAVEAVFDTDEVVYVVEIVVIQPGAITEEQGFFWTDGFGWTS